MVLKLQDAELRPPREQTHSVHTALNTRRYCMPAQGLSHSRGA
jgi:hypothetical protein